MASHSSLDVFDPSTVAEDELLEPKAASCSGAHWAVLVLESGDN